MFYFWVAGETCDYIASTEEVDYMKGMWEKCIGDCKGAKFFTFNSRKSDVVLILSLICSFPNLIK